MTDNRGTELEVGQRVVYNISGQLAAGVIEVCEPGRGGYKRLIKVRLEHRAAGHFPGHISNVRHERNLLVLLDGES